MTEDFIPALAIIFVFGAPVAAWIVSRVLAHQERIEMIRNGYMPPPDPRAMRRAAKYGPWPGGPVPPPAGGLPPNMGVPGYGAEFYAQAQMRKGIMVALVGFALLIGLSFIGATDGGYHTGPWLLGGLIPLFVGIAQIINAVLNGAQIPGIGGVAAGGAYGPRPMNQGAPQPPPQPPSAPSGPYAGQYGGWRPGNTPEIEKPAPPPDMR